MDRPTLNDPGEYPADELLERRLGRATPAWNAFQDLIRLHPAGLSGEWRYYPDGKSWLFKVTRKAQTVCWVSVWEKFFKVSFYLTAGAEEAIRSSSLDQALQDAFLHPAGKGALRPVTVEVRKKRELAAVGELVGIKLK